MNKIKEKALNLIVEEAAGLFLKNSISSVTMEDIAKSAEIGAASLYRYFGTKQALAVKAATLLAENVYRDSVVLDGGKDGYSQIEDFYMSYLRVFKEKREYFRFIREFDALFLTGSGDGIAEYESEIDMFRQSYMKAYEKGLSDGSVLPQDNADAFYYSTTHALLSLCKEMTRENRLVSKDGGVSPEDEIKTLITVILQSLRAQDRHS